MSKFPVAIACLKQVPSNLFDVLKPSRSILINDVIAIGRDSTCQVIFPKDQNISKRHLEIRPVFASNSKPKWEIRDLGSTNGTYVNSQFLQSPLFLESGDRVQLGTRGPKFVFKLSDVDSRSDVED